MTVNYDETSFTETFRPFVRPNGDLFEHSDVVNAPLNTVWTVVEAQNGDWCTDWVALPGFHIVNKLGYLMTEEPWTDETCSGVYFDGSDFPDEDEEE